MRTTLRIDDDLLAKARALTGIIDKTSLVRLALITLIEREAACCLARLGGSEPGANRVVRRRIGYPSHFLGRRTGQYAASTSLARPEIW